MIEQCLGKSMDQTEIDLLLKSYKQLYPVDAELVEQCLKKVQANYGNRMYVGFYMERLAETKTTKTNKR